MEMETVSNQEALQLALKESGLKQSDLARMMNVNRATISTNMRRDRMGFDVFARILDVMGYEVVVARRTESGLEPRWIVK